MTDDRNRGPWPHRLSPAEQGRTPTPPDTYEGDNPDDLDGVDHAPSRDAADPETDLPAHVYEHDTADARYWARRPSRLRRPATAAQLATWSRGNPTDEASVRLLVASGLLRKVEHLVERSDRSDLPGAVPEVWLPWDVVARELAGGTLAALSGGERRVLAVALSIAGAAPVDLRDAMTGIDPANAERVLDALAHVAGIPRR